MAQSQHQDLKRITGSLKHCLNAMGKQLNLDGNRLFEYARTAPHIEKARFPGGSGSEDERRILYALVRALRPQHAIECGVSWGGSTTAILAALYHNEHGFLEAVDNREVISNQGHRVGCRIPNQLRIRLKLIIGDAVQILQHSTTPIDFMFEDTYHKFDLTRAIYEATLPLLKKNAVVLSHDPRSYPDVAKAIVSLGLEPTIYITDKSHCGLTLWQNK